MELLSAVMLTVGLVARLLYVLMPNIQRYDYSKISTVLALSTLGALHMASDSGSSYEDAQWLPIYSLLGFALTFRKRLLPTITEGTLLLHGLLALFLFYTFTINDAPFTIWEIFLAGTLVGFSAVASFLCLSRTRPHWKTQVVLMSAFILINVFIGIQTFAVLPGTDSALWNYFLLGYFSLEFASGVIYLFLFYPFTMRGKNQSKSSARADRDKRINDNLELFEQKYIDGDLYRSRTLLLFTLGGALFLNTQLELAPWFTAFSAVAFLGTLLTGQKNLAQFTPRTTQ